MHWTEPATADDSHAELEKKLWDAANQLWAGADLKPSEYSPTVLGLIFLRYADVRFVAIKEEIQPQAGARRKIGPTDFHAAGVVYLPDEARFSHLLSLPESANLGQTVNEAMPAPRFSNTSSLIIITTGNIPHSATAPRPNSRPKSTLLTKQQTVQKPVTSPSAPHGAELPSPSGWSARSSARAWWLRLCRMWGGALCGRD